MGLESESRVFSTEKGEVVRSLTRSGDARGSSTGYFKQITHAPSDTLVFVSPHVRFRVTIRGMSSVSCSSLARVTEYGR